MKAGSQNLQKNQQYLELFGVLKQIQQTKPSEKSQQKVIDTKVLLQLQKYSQSIQQNRKQKLQEQTNKYQNYLSSQRTLSPPRDKSPSIQQNVNKSNERSVWSYVSLRGSFFNKNSKQFTSIANKIFSNYSLSLSLKNLSSQDQCVNLFKKPFHNILHNFSLNQRKHQFDTLQNNLDKTDIKTYQYFQLQFRNPDLNLTDLKQTAYRQIPKEIREWIILDPKLCQNVIENTLYRQDIDQLKQIKNIPKQYDSCFAPFCILLNFFQPTQTQKADGKIYQSWHAQFLKITSTTNNILKFMSIDFSTIKQSQIDEIIYYLNKYTLKQVEGLNQAALKLFIWTRALVSLYHIDNIFLIRKPQQLLGNGNEKIIESMIIIQKEKDIINKLRRIMKNDKMFKIYLDFNQMEVPQVIQEKSIPFFSIDNAQLIQQLLNYLTLKDILKLRLTNTFIKELCHVYILSCLSEQITSLERKKMQYINQIYPVMPPLYENGFFSDFFEISSELLMKKYYLVDRHSFSKFKCQTKPSQSLEKFCKIMSIIFNIQAQPNSQPPPVQQKQNMTLSSTINGLNNGSQKDQYFQYIKNAITSKTFDQYLKQFNPYHLNAQKIKESEELAFSLENDLMNDPNQIGIIEDLQGLRLATMPLDYCNPNILQENLLEQYSDIYSITDSCQRLFKVCYHFSLLSAENMKIITTQAYESLQNDHQMLVSQLQKKEFQQLRNLYQRARDQKELNSEKVQLIMIEIIERYNTQQRSNEVTQKLKIAREKQQKTKQFINYFKSIFLKNILHFLTLTDLVSFAQVSKDSYCTYKVYLNFRIHIEAAQIKSLEMKYENQIKSIERKKRIYLQNSELTYPEKEHAIQLLTEINVKDISSLKRISKSSAGFEIFALPVVELLDIKLEYKQVYLKKQPDYWQSLFKFMQINDFNKILQEFQVEVVETNKIKKIEKFIKENDNFTIQTSFKLCESLSKLTKWVFGVIEIHKFLRRYSLSEDEEEMMNKQELQIAKYLDFRYIGKNIESQREYEFWNEQFMKEKRIQQKLEDGNPSNENEQQTFNNNTKSIISSPHYKHSHIIIGDDEDDYSVQNQNHNSMNQTYYQYKKPNTSKNNNKINKSAF